MSEQDMTERWRQVKNTTHAEYMAGLREAELMLDNYARVDAFAEGQAPAPDLVAAALYWVGDLVLPDRVDSIRAFAAMKVLAHAVSHPVEERA